MTTCPRCATPLDRLPARCPVCAGGVSRTADRASRRVVAAYLAGAAVAEGELRAAWGDARGDDAFTAHLRDELGLDAADSPCAGFRDQAAAFAELPPAARAREAPDLSEHARGCPACRRLLWQLRPLWDGGVLAEPLRVAVGAGVRDRGLGPPAAPVVFAALRAGPDDADPAALEWALDPLRLRVSAGPRVWLAVDGNVGTVEFTTAAGAGYYAGALADLPPDGLPLPPGRWGCVVRVGGRAWRFELDLTPGDA